MSTPEADDAIAAELVAARTEGRSLTGFPGAIPGSMAEAYRIQDRAISQWSDSLAGWKIGFIPADRRVGRGAGPAHRPDLASAVPPQRRAGNPHRDGHLRGRVRRRGSRAGHPAGSGPARSHRSRLDGRGGGGLGAGTADRHRGGQQPDPGHQLARPHRDRRRLREQQRPGARLRRWRTVPENRRCRLPVISTDNSLGKDRPRTCPEECTMGWPRP